MGMFDKPSGQPWADNFALGENFVLTSAKLVQGVVTDYGKGTMCVLTINGEDYTIFGRGIAGQIENMEDGDLPERVKIACMPPKKGQSPMKMIVPAKTPTVDATIAGKSYPIITEDAPVTPANGDGDIPF